MMHRGRSGEVVLSREEFDRVAEMVIEGIETDGDHHKQWYLAEIGRTLQIDLSAWDEETELGVPG